MSSRFRYLLLLAFVAAFVLPMGAAADNNSPNMRIDWSNRQQPAPTHSDIAAWGNIVVAGSYDGFRVFDKSLPVENRLLVTYKCRGPQNDVSLWNYNGRLLLFQSIDTPQVNGDTTCGQTHASDTTACGVPHDCFEGIRIFDLTNPASPVLIKGVYTACGSHTHTLVPDLANNRVLLYVSSYPSSTGPLCVYPHAKISIVGVPLAAPETASVISTPPVEAPVGFFGVGCHDITVFMAIHKAAASCQSEGQIWDISDPANPVTTGASVIHMDNASVYFWHSAEFTWDGQYVVFDDEGNGSCSPTGNGKIWIYRVSDGQFMSSFMIPRSQSQYCSVHNANFIPIAGRYLLVAAWYWGGTGVIDLTDPMNPHEIAYYQGTTGAHADTWSSYWYNGKIYANDIARGLDVFDVIIPHRPIGETFGHLNAQTQEDLLPSIQSSRPLALLAPGRP